MATYNTIQRESLLSFFHDHCHTAMTVPQIYEKMICEETDYVPGESTIYRLVKRLADEGVLTRRVDVRSRQYIYQLADGEACHCKVRMRCKICGKIIELHHDCSHKLLGDLLKNESFSADHEITITGICGDCK
ncbi:MAG: transcriptional repressor [Oscillospiraceae bacterium]|nr:transcriptional repressor [Oscillospiraceae bacterium]